MYEKMTRSLTIMMATGVLILGGCATNQAANSHPDKVVYHVNDAVNATATLRNIGNHLEVNPQAQIVVITHA